MAKTVAIADKYISRSLASDAVLITGAVALIALAAQVSIPLWPVPVTLSTFAVMVVAATLGSARGSISIVGYLTAGALGLPVFANAAALSAVRPTFGYLAGFVLAAAIIGFFVTRGAAKKPVVMLGVFTLATAVIYATGVAWLVTGFGMGLPEAIAAGVVPFLIGDAVKVLAATALVTGVSRLKA